MCPGCAKKLTICPFCKRDGSEFEPASTIFINEIKKIKYRCQFGSDDKGAKCSNTTNMNPQQLFQHYAFDCAALDRFNRYTLKVRDRQFCRYYCKLEGASTAQFGSEDQNAKNDCHNCKRSEDQTNKLLKMQCHTHLNSQTFKYIKHQMADSLMKRLVCTLCDEIPLVPRMC